MSDSYTKTRDRLEIYFGKTSSKAWELLTTDVPVSGVRARVRAGRQQMREVLLSSFPQDLEGCRILDAGCGTGQISVELACKGAEVVGVDISERLITVAEKRLPEALKKKVKYEVGDMLDEKYGTFDYVIAMDSLIHYNSEDIAKSLGSLSRRTKKAISFTVAPKTLFLSLLLGLGKVLPSSERSPRLSPINYGKLVNEIEKGRELAGWELKVLKRVTESFYVSEAMTLVS